MLDRRWLISVLLCVLALGCGGNAAPASSAAARDTRASSGHESDEDDDAPPPNSVVRREGSGSVAARLGPPGGTLELVGGPRVEIPAGSVEGGQDFVLKVATKTTAFLNKESEKPVGPVFSFSPGVAASDGRSITVSLPLPAMPEGFGDPAIAYEIDLGAIAHGEDSTRTRWQYENARHSGGRLVAELPEVTGLRMQFVLTNLEAQ